jgi:hypothetical protein
MMELELHPIAVDAATYFVKDKRSFSDDSLAKLIERLETLHGKPELGPALASLVQVAQHLDLVEKAKPAAMALMNIAVSQTAALEELNKLAKHAHEDEARKKRKAFAKFSGN